MAPDMDRIATVAYASAVQLLNELFAGADPDRKADVLLRILPFFEGCALAAHDTLCSPRPIPQPSRN